MRHHHFGGAITLDILRDLHRVSVCNHSYVQGPLRHGVHPVPSPSDGPDLVEVVCATARQKTLCRTCLHHQMESFQAVNILRLVTHSPGETREIGSNERRLCTHKSLRDIVMQSLRKSQHASYRPMEPDAALFMLATKCCCGVSTTRGL